MWLCVVWCVARLGRDVLNLHTEVFETDTRERGGKGWRGERRGEERRDEEEMRVSGFNRRERGGGGSPSVLLTIRRPT